MVWCNVDGKSEGLQFMLDTFRRYGVQATFFVETVQRYYFRNDPMGAIARQIHAAGHEVQLHTHPCWALFEHGNWRELASQTRKRDDFDGRSVDDSARLLEQGIRTFAEWGLPRPKVFRSGNLQHDDNLYRALARVGIPYSSNVAVAIHSKGDANYQLYSGVHDRHQVREFPVLTFRDWKLGPKRHLKSLTIAGSSFSETRRLLEQARSAGIEQVVILTHPFEYVQSHDLAFSCTRRNALTQKRLVKLCEFLHVNNDRFEACGMAAAAEAAHGADARNTLLEGSLMHTIPRMAAQVAHHHLGRWLLARRYGRRPQAT